MNPEIPPTASSLIEAIRQKDHAQLRELLKTCTNPSIRSPAGRTILHAAAEEGDLEFAQIALEAGCDVNATMINGWSALHIAASYGKSGFEMLLHDPDKYEKMRVIDLPTPATQEAVAQLINEKPGATYDLFGNHEERLSVDQLPQFINVIECIFDPKKLYRELVARGLNIDETDPKFVEYLLGQPRYIRVAELLLEHGACISAISNDCRSAIYYSVEALGYGMLKLLFDKGAKLKDEPTAQMELVDLAVQFYEIEIANLLIKNGAVFDPNKSKELFDKLTGSSLELKAWFLERGANVNQRDAAGNTPILYVVGMDGANFKWLVDNGADIHVHNYEGTGLLHQASEWEDSLDLVLPLGLPINGKNHEGRTPLHFARFDWKCIIKLAQNGADVNSQDNEGNTALHLLFASDEFRPDIEWAAFHTLVLQGADRSAKNHKGETSYDICLHWDYPEEYRQLLNPDPTQLRDPRNFVYFGYGDFDELLPRALTPVEIDEKIWPSVLHYFHAQKTGNSELQESIRTAATVSDALTVLRDHGKESAYSWEYRCDHVMYFALLKKFEQHAILREKLLSTGSATIVLDSNCESYWTERRNVVFNTIGKMIMNIRNELGAKGSADGNLG